MRILTVGNSYTGLGGYELMWQAGVEGLRAAGHEVEVLVGGRGFEEAAARAELVSFWSMGGLPMRLVAHRPAVAFVHDRWPDYGPRLDGGTPADLPPATYWVSEFVRRGRPGEVLASGYDERLFTPAPERPEWGGRLLLPGRLDERKGHRVALYAFGGGFVVAGSGDRRLAWRLRRKGVTLLGRLDQWALAEEYARADAVLFPVTWEEPWGLVPLEAMAVGRPVVATGTGGSGEYLRHEVNCLLVPAGDAVALRAAVERLAREPELRVRLREGGFATAARFTRARFVECVVAAHERHSPR